MWWESAWEIKKVGRRGSKEGYLGYTKNLLPNILGATSPRKGCFRNEERERYKE